MSDISPIGNTDRLSALSPNRLNGSGAAALEAPRTRPSDRVEFSDAARLLSKIANLPDVRDDKVQEVRAQIDSGTYETDDKIDATVDALLDEIG